MSTIFIIFILLLVLAGVGTAFKFIGAVIGFGLLAVVVILVLVALITQN